jgi:hypothetical protein
MYEYMSFIVSIGGLILAAIISIIICLPIAEGSRGQHGPDLSDEEA